MATIREQIGEDLYAKLEDEANKEVALAMQMDLVDQYRQEKYYQRRQLLTLLLSEFEAFQNKNLRISLIDIVFVLFETKLLYASKNEHEYNQRIGGGNLMAEPPFSFNWEERNQPIEKVIGTHLEQLESSIRRRSLATEIRDFYTGHDNILVTNFFNALFLKFDVPFRVQIKDCTSKNHSESDQRGGQLEEGKLAFTFAGSSFHVYFFGMAYLRTFLNMLRVAGFIYRGQVDFGMWGVEMMAPSSPFFIEPGVMGGGYSWDEDKKRPWEKIPDGCLFISYGYRGLTAMFLDTYRFDGVQKFFLDNPIFFEKLKNPWSKECVHDISTSLDILSSATQIPDLGAKILQIYCCLEHLFVPQSIRKDNIKYIIGAINALRPDLLPWFEELYEIRCAYAHKGYIQRNDRTLNLVFTSMTNTIALMSAKLKQT